MMASHSSPAVSGARFGTGTSTKSMSSSAVNSSNSSLRQNSLSGPRSSSPFMLPSSTLSTESLHPFVGPSDGKGGSAPVNANTQPGRVLPTVSQRSVGPCRGGSRPDPEATGLRGQGALRRLFCRAMALHDVIATCWIGDFIGGLALFSLLIIGLFLGWGAGLQ